jgi:hypothetical protein
VGFRVAVVSAYGVMFVGNVDSSAVVVDLLSGDFIDFVIVVVGWFDTADVVGGCMAVVGADKPSVVVGVIVADSVVVIPVGSNENDGTATIVIVVTAASNDVAGFVGVRDVALAFAIGQVAFVNA